MSGTSLRTLRSGKRHCTSEPSVVNKIPKTLWHQDKARLATHCAIPQDLTKKQHLRKNALDKDEARVLFVGALIAESFRYEWSIQECSFRPCRRLTPADSFRSEIALEAASRG